MVTGGALAGFWVIPFLLRLPYTNDMGWEKINTIQDTLLVNGKFTWVVVIAAIGGVTSLLQRHCAGIFLSVMAVLSWIGFATAPQGRLWNARLLPFWFLCIWLLAGLAVSEIAVFIATTIRMARQPDPVSMSGGQPIEADGLWGPPPAPQTEDAASRPAVLRWLNGSSGEGVSDGDDDSVAARAVLLLAPLFAVVV